MSRLTIQKIVWGDTLEPPSVQITLRTGVIASISRASVSVYDADTLALVVDASEADVTVPTSPSWPPTWGTGANQIPEPATFVRYFLRWRITTSALVYTLPWAEWIVESRHPY